MRPRSQELPERQPLVLELVGLPGAGKTTLARRVVERLAEEGYLCCNPRFSRPGSEGEWTSRMRRLVAMATSYIANRRLAVTVLQFGLAIRPLRLRRLKWLREPLDFVYTIRTASWKHDLIILDQAFLQAIWSATVHGTLPRAPLLERLSLQATSASGARVIFLYLVVDPETALERIAGRRGARSRFDRLSPEDRAILLAALQERLAQIVDCAAGATRAPVLRLDGRESVDELCETIVDYLAVALDDRVPW